MPKIKQLDWTKLTPNPQKSKQFNITPRRKPIRQNKLPQPYRQEFAQNMQHLRNIMNEY